MDGGNREANKLLKVGDVWVANVLWWPLIDQARNTLSAANLPRPTGLANVGEYSMRAEVIKDTILVKYVLWYRQRGATSATKIGWFILDFLPEPKYSKATKPVQTHGKAVLINCRRNNPLARVCRVFVDEHGLPVPVPEEVWPDEG